MGFTEKKEFLTEDYKSMVENLNKISYDLLKVKWYFLATISALGVAYIKFITVDSNSILSNSVAFIVICLVGNIIFWLICEYVIAHGFLFRLIQQRQAIIAEKFYSCFNNKQRNILIRNPCDKKIKENDRLVFDKILPDQFLPTYWASIWFIFLNTVVSCYLQYKYAVTIHPWYYPFNILTLIFISSQFIMKIWNYYLFKTKTMFENNCGIKLEFKEKDTKDQKDFIPKQLINYKICSFSCFLGVISYLFLISIIILYIFPDIDLLSRIKGLSICWLIIIGLLISWPIILGLCVYVLTNFIFFDHSDSKFLHPIVEISGNETVYIKEHLSRFRHLCCLLVMIM